MKAANVLITKNGILKLADFGLARAFSVSKSGQPNRFVTNLNGPPFCWFVFLQNAMLKSDIILHQYFGIVA